MTMAIGILTLHLMIQGCSSLKEKRSRIKPLIARLHREFDISVAETDHQDAWQQAVLECALVCNDRGHTQQMLQKVCNWIETYWPDVSLIESKIELI